MNQQLQLRIKLLKQMQSDHPDTASWFDEPLEQLINEDCSKEVE